MPKTVTQKLTDMTKPVVDKQEIVTNNKPKPVIVMMPIGDLVHPKYNPRKISDKDFAQLKKSLEKFDAVQPAIINIRASRKNIIVGGNQRVDAAKSLGWTEFPCVEVDLDEKNERELNIRLNRNSGDWDFTLLRDLFKSDDLLDFGFDPKQDTKLRDFLTATSDYSKLDSGDGVVKEEALELLNEDSVYCACRQHFDVGRGICQHDCAYCFVRATPAGQAQVPGRYILASKRFINDTITDVENHNWPVHIGVCNDPAMSVFHPALGYTLERATQKGITVFVGTKNPAAIVKGLEAFKIDWQYVAFKVAFSICKDDISAVIEHGAPTVNDRIKSAEYAAKAGADIVLRFAPMVVGYYENMANVMHSFAKMGCNRVLVEPLRISATGRRYFERLGKGLYLDNFSLEAYLERIKNKTEKFYGALHWHDYDKALLREAYTTVKGMATKAGLQFGICNAELGFEYCDLNEGDFCCQTKRMKERKTGYDEHSLTSMVANKQIKKLRLPILAEDFCKDEEEYEVMLGRIGWLNSHKFKLNF